LFNGNGWGLVAELPYFILDVLGDGVLRTARRAEAPEEEKEGGKLRVRKSTLRIRSIWRIFLV